LATPRENIFSDINLDSELAPNKYYLADTCTVRGPDRNLTPQ
jgi:hypothetical protein